MAFLIPTEIVPSKLRPHGNGSGITGWATGFGWTDLVDRNTFSGLENRTYRGYLLFAGINLLWIPTVYLFYRKPKIDIWNQLTALEIPFNWKMEESEKH